MAGIASIEDVIKILEKALYLTTLTKSLPSAAMLQYKFIPLYMSSVSSLFFSSIGSSITCIPRIDDIIAALKLKRYPVSKDGNCIVLHQLQWD